MAHVIQREVTFKNAINWESDKTRFSYRPVGLSCQERIACDFGKLIEELGILHRVFQKGLFLIFITFIMLI